MSMIALEGAMTDAPARTAAQGFRAETLRGAASIAAVYTEWQALADAVAAPNWSMLPAAHEVWLRQLRRPDSSPLITVRDPAGRLRAVFALMRDRVRRGPAMAPRFDYDPADGRLLGPGARRLFPLRQVAAATSMPATLAWGAPLCRPEDLGPVIDAVADAILAERGWDVAVLSAAMPDEFALWQAAFARRGHRLHRQALDRVVQNVAPVRPFSALSAGQPMKARQNLRRAERFAAEMGVGFRFVEGSAAVAAEFRLIRRIAEASWKAAGRAGNPLNIPYDARQQAYVEGLFTSPLLKGQPLLGIAEGPEGPCNVLLLLQAGGTVTALLTFWDGRYDRCSPGLLLLGRSIDLAVARGALRYDLNATAPWVRHVANERTEVVNAVLFSHGVWGRLMEAVALRCRRLQ